MISVGQRFGRWTVIGDSVYTKKNAMIQCRCDCGFENGVSVASLIAKVSTQCNRCARQKEKNSQWRGIGKIGAGKYRGVKGASSRQLLSDLWEASDGRCAMTGWPISIEDGSASPDRIDSSVGYVSGNVQWVHQSVNIAKNHFEMDHFISLCHAVARKFPDPNVIVPSMKFGRKRG